MLLNTSSLLLVCLAGVLGWYLSQHSPSSRHHHRQSSPSPPPPLTFSLWGQIFGYLCAALYLGSRIPQLLLNAKRKSTEGVSMLFFMFACVGNLTYVLSILAYAPSCATRSGGRGRVKGARCEDGEAERLYARYILVNASWLLGSLGTLALDGAIFVQFFLYREGGKVEDLAVVDEEEDERE